MNNFYGQYTLNAVPAPTGMATWTYGKSNQPKLIAAAELALPTVLVLPSPKPEETTNSLRTYVGAALDTIKYQFAQTGDLNNPTANAWSGFTTKVNGVPNWARFLQMVVDGRFSKKEAMGFEGAALLAKLSLAYPAEIISAAKYAIPSGYQKGPTAQEKAAAAAAAKKAANAAAHAKAHQLKIENEKKALQQQLLKVSAMLKAQTAAKGSEDAMVKVLQQTLATLKAELAKRESEMKKLLGEKDSGIPMWAWAVGGLAILLVVTRAGKR